MHHARFTYGRSVHNVRIERLQQDVRKDTLKGFRQAFLYLEECNLLNVEAVIHQTCLFIIYQLLVQVSLDQSREAWNQHRVRTEGNKTPRALWELSREAAIHEGFWYGNPGNDIDLVADPLYRQEAQFVHEAAEEQGDKEEIQGDNGDKTEIKRRLAEMHYLLGYDFNLQSKNDNRWGTGLYCHVVEAVANYLQIIVGRDTEQTVEEITIILEVSSQ